MPLRTNSAGTWWPRDISPDITCEVKATSENHFDESVGENDFHVIVVTGTVLPGVTEGVVKELLETFSGKK